MKVLMTTDSVGGVWTYSLELARALEPFGVETVLATMGPLPRVEQQRDANQIHSVTLISTEYKLEWMDDPWEDVQAAGEWLLACERTFQPDLVHLNGYVHAALPWQSPRLVVAHSCVLSWWNAVCKPPVPNLWNRYQREVNRGLRAADLIVAPTQSMFDSLKRNYEFRTPHATIPNGREPAGFQTRPKEPFILAAGRFWDEAKNLEALDRVADRIEWPIHVAGPIESPQHHSISLKHVKPLGILSPPALADCMGRAAIYALPARYEPFGLSILEAAFSGCALVLGDIASLRELWMDAAIFVPPENHEALHIALQTLITRSELREQMARRARQRAQQYTAERMGSEYMRMYQHLLSDKRAAIETANSGRG
jgi:glycogen synthase